MSDSDALVRENEDLRRRLAYAEDALRAVTDAEVDAVANEAGAAPVLLRDAQERLRRSEARFRAVIEKSAEVISLTAADGTTTYLTPASAAAVLGWTAEDVATLTPRDQVVPEDRARLEAELERLVRTGARDFALEFRVRHKDGSIRWLESTGTNLLDDPNVRAIVGNYRDITVRKEAEESNRASVDALRASEERYRRIIEGTSDGVWMYDAQAATTFMNARMAEMLGYTVDEVVGMPVYAFIEESNNEAAQARTARRLQGIAERSDFKFHRKDGTELWTSAQSNPLFDAEGRYEGGVALVADITAQRRADEARARLAAIIESSEDAILSISPDGMVTSWNSSAERMFQYSADEMVGKSIAVLVPPAILDDERRTFESILLTRATLQIETSRLRKDGTRVEVAMTVSPVRDAEGKVIGLSEIVRDLTDHRKTQATLRRTEEQFRQAQKMEAVGRLAGGVAHDFNNLLSVILSYASLIEGELKLGDPIGDDVNEIAKAGERATQLTRQLLAFSRQQVLQPRVIDLAKVVADMQPMLRRLLGEDIELAVLADRHAGRALADPGQIEQVVMNLAVNARDAMPEGGKLTVETTNVTLDEAYVDAHLGVAPGDYVLLSISDTGMGMDAETRARVFEPFFTTKDQGKGTGLGLSTVFGIVEQSRGHIWVYSEPGAGTTFKIYFPRTDRPMSGAATSMAPRTALRGTETILLVEDEEHVRTVACVILRRNGYNVLAASNGGEALLIAEEFAGRIHLLLTDVVMPHLSGRKLVERLAPLRPDMKTLFASGYTDDAILRHGVLDAGVAFLQKPFTPDGLLQKVREVLGAE